MIKVPYQNPFLNVIKPIIIMTPDLNKVLNDKNVIEEEKKRAVNATFEKEWNLEFKNKTGLSKKEALRKAREEAVFGEMEYILIREDEIGYSIPRQQLEDWFLEGE